MVAGPVAGALLGAFSDRRWDYAFCFMVPSGLIGGSRMWTIRNRTRIRS